MADGDRGDFEAGIVSFGQYTPDDRGMRQFRFSDTVGNAMGKVANDFAAQANARGRSRYVARQKLVRGGHQNSERAGAEVTEEQRHWNDVRERLLVNLSRDFRMRGG